MAPVSAIQIYTKFVSKGLRTWTHLFMEEDLSAFPVLEVNKSISAYLPAGRCYLGRQNSLRYPSDLKILNISAIISINENTLMNERYDTN